ncbi:GyrI-like domain-containing protein [Pedobacter miscanthi]|jgi:predicted transcriptional regulator YdeE|uniref:GyrI-like domain-containing protein n=1 Tax=Pedobacter miscanthi TaxID=2259170 RepID=UPI00293071BD|nr:GyrI-like domain-containing protein [Pedobacter miscanthi]
MRDAFKIIGISTRTTNQNNQSAEDLGKLWSQFYTENIFDKIPNKVSNDIITIYTDYVSNYTDAYTTIIGVPVSTLENIPDGLIGREFGAENFQKFTAKGAMPNAVVNTWMDIWKSDGELNRKYTYDLEVYGEKSQDGEHAEVEIFIAIN